ncbi:hypothetical protein BC628DRAFT_1496256 [Trametes gibbosa]|nr:hypothetical protein BC628DRAFT_1496256 [Trametes gibbosa]
MPSDHTSLGGPGLSSPLPLLNFDVFRVILTWLPHTALLRTSLASHHTRDEATKELLMRPVRILRVAKLRSFYRFMLNGDLNRPSYLRQLTLAHMEGPLEWGDVDALLRLFALCTNLNKLALQWCDVLFQESDIPPVISALPSLRHFSAWTYRDGHELQSILIREVINMRASLRSLRLPLVSEALATTDIFALLATTHNQLESLTIQLSVSLPSGVVFPSVRILHLIFEDGLPTLQEIDQTFPHVKELSLDCYAPLDDLPHIDTSRRVLPHPSSWHSLDHLRASMHVIRTLGIACPVRNLDLSFYDRDEHNQMADTIARLRPQKLATSLHCAPDWLIPCADPHLLLYESGEAGVKHLFVRMSYSRSNEPQTQDVIKTLQPLLQTSRVELFHLAISGFFTSDDPEEIVNPPIMLYPDSPDTDASPHVDTDVVARSAAELGTYIRTVAITIVFLGHMVWSVDRLDGEVVMSKLRAFEGAQTLDREAKRYQDH